MALLLWAHALTSTPVLMPVRSNPVQTQAPCFRFGLYDESVGNLVNILINLIRVVLYVLNLLRHPA
jgi:hypothetical protein